MPQDQDCQKWVEALQEMKDSLYRVKGGELPQTGDLIFFHNSEEDGDTADQYRNHHSSGRSHGRCSGEGHCSGRRQSGSGRS